MGVDLCTHRVSVVVGTAINPNAKIAMNAKSVNALLSQPTF